MKIADIMTPDAECTSADATLEKAAQLMKTLDVGSLPVCENDRLVGMITDRDITIRCVADGKDPKQQTVRETMTPDVFYCFDDQDVAEAAELMEERQVRRLPVLNRNKRMVGIVALADLAVDTGDEKMAGEALEGVSEPAQPAQRGQRAKGSPPPKSAHEAKPPRKG